MKKLFLFLSLLTYITHANAQWVQTICPIHNLTNALVTDGLKIYAGTNSGGGIFVSADGGTTWTLPSSLFSPSQIFALINKSPNIFVGSSMGTYKSSNGGVSWTSVDTGSIMGDVYSFAVTDTTIFAGSYSAGIFKSTNDGATWTAVNTGITNFTCLGLAINSSGIYASTAGGIFKSTNNGASWSDMTITYGSPNTSCVTSCGTKLITGSFYTGMYRSVNNGLTWTAANSGLTTTDVRALLTVGGTVFAGTNDGAYYSIDTGNTWIPYDTGFTSTTSVGSLLRYSSSIFAGTVFYGVWKRQMPVGTGVQELTTENISVYPNPSSSFITVSIPSGSEKGSIAELYNLLGEEVYSVQLINDKTDIDVSKQSNGIYFIMIYTAKGIVSKRIVKQ